MKLTGSVVVKSNRTSSKLRGVKVAVGGSIDVAAQVMLPEMQRRVPVGPTHEVLDSLEIRRRYGDDTTVAVGSFGIRRPIARWLDSGTVKMHARPFMRPAAALGRKALKQAAEEKVRAEMMGDA